jgi:cob(I)alamin adenosyltransferase
MSKSKIYTRTGDTGMTSLIGNNRVEKSHPRLEAYGTIDELNACLGILRSYPIDEISNANIIRIQKQLFVIGAHLATETSNNDKYHSNNADEEIKFLETEMDKIDDDWPPLKSFVIPGGNIVSAQCNNARTVCRRAERRINALFVDNFVEGWILQYINRLSDYLFVLARYFSKKFEEKEILWLPKL